MLRTRVIPCLLLQDGMLVRSENFSFHQIVGNPIRQVQRYNEWAVDELIYLDISRGDAPFDLRRDDAKIKNIPTFLEVVKAVSKNCFVPLTVGGRITSLGDIRVRLSLGADKIVVNSHAIKNQEFISAASKSFGAQCIVVAIDYRKDEDGGYEAFADNGRTGMSWNPVEWAIEAEKRGAGEIFLNSIDRDGTAEGFDLELTRKVVHAVSIPVITAGGAGVYSDFAKAILEGEASAVAAANIFHFRENSDMHIKKAMAKEGVRVRTGRKFRTVNDGFAA
ncbi:MAG: imidazole glycerol phosphate synthase cyclase subunit [Pirellulaceae bacterium]|jgi:cyclase|nr:imidazole glycerol phosphate synthase cyclase subunit [Pirellulaceae bacterium]